MQTHFPVPPDRLHDYLARAGRRLGAGPSSTVQADGAGSLLIEPGEDAAIKRRHQMIGWDLQRFAESPAPRTFAITGASGFIGTALGAFLEAGGHTVRRLVRRQAGPGEVSWNPERGEVDLAGLAGVDTIIHLAGENIGAGRWTDARKEVFRKSRVEGTRTIANAAVKARIKTLLSASAIGWYGDRGDAPVDEESTKGSGFLADLCDAWEAAADPARVAGIRVVHPRIGVVMAKDGGPLAQMLTPFRLGVGGAMGSGQQYMSWIWREDVLGALLRLSWDTQFEGPVNLTAPTPVTNGQLSRALGAALHRPAVLPIPAFAIRTLFGEMGQTVLLEGARVLPTRLEQADFPFLQPTLEGCLAIELNP